MCLFTPQREDSSKKTENDDGIESCGRNDHEGTSQDEVSSWEGKNRKQDSHPQLKNSFPECLVGSLLSQRHSSSVSLKRNRALKSKINIYCFLCFSS